MVETIFPLNFFKNLFLFSTIYDKMQANTLEEGLRDIMELNKCSRCGAFHANEGDVCPKCTGKDSLELSKFKTYIEENGFSSIDTIATQTGIAQKNVNRFMNYEGIEIPEEQKENFACSGVVLN